LEESLRSKLDGKTYFGSKKKLNGKVVNGCVMKSRDSMADARNAGRHFMIFYIPEEDAYFLRDLGIGSGVFACVD
jgi:hypothetical protein